MDETLAVKIHVEGVLAEVATGAKWGGWQLPLSPPPVQD